MTFLTFVLQVGILTDNQIRNNLLKLESRDKRLVMFKNEVCVKTMVKLAVVKLAAAATAAAAVAAAAASTEEIEKSDK